MEDIPADELTGAVVMASGPIEVRSPDDIRRWLEADHSDERLASVMAAVSNKTTRLRYGLDDVEYGTEEYERKEKEYDEWWAMEGELVRAIRKKLEEENAKMGTSHITKGIGTHYIVKPFMERNGFIDGCGWWVKQKDDAL